MAKATKWSEKVVALLKSGNTSAAIAQIKVAPSAKDLEQLRQSMSSAGMMGRWRDVDAAVIDNIALLSAPRLHRSP